jgi:phytoene dehydrogenase-like protein
VKYRSISERPVLEIHQPTIQDPKLAPAGHAVASVLVHFASYEQEPPWDTTRRESLYRTVLSTLVSHAPELESAVVAYDVLTPLDLEQRFGLTGGHIHHGEQVLDQWLVRPVPACAAYRTPIEGLFLCGSGSHPGGGLTCAPGALAAATMLSAD